LKGKIKEIQGGREKMRMIRFDLFQSENRGGERETNTVGRGREKKRRKTKRG